MSTAIGQVSGEVRPENAALRKGKDEGKTLEPAQLETERLRLLLGRLERRRARLEAD